MKGKKTWAAVLGSWLTGALPIIGGIASGEPEHIMGGIQQGLPFILAGFFGLGLGHKIEKAADAVKKNGAAGGEKPAGGGVGSGSRKAVQ